MRKIAILLIACFGLGILALAQEAAGFKGTRTVILTEKARVGAEVLAAGEYKVTHTMEGAEHIMVFQKGDQQYRIKCTLQPLSEKAHTTQFFYEHATGERVLQAIVFRNDAVRHVFAQ